MDTKLVEDCRRLKGRLMEDFHLNAKSLTNNYGKFGILTIQTFQPRLSKPIIDEIQGDPGCQDTKIAFAKVQPPFLTNPTYKLFVARRLL